MQNKNNKILAVPSYLKKREDGFGGPQASFVWSIIGETTGVLFGRSSIVVRPFKEELRLVNNLTILFAVNEYKLGNHVLLSSYSQLKVQLHPCHNPETKSILDFMFAWIMTEDKLKEKVKALFMLHSKNPYEMESFLYAKLKDYLRQ